MIWQAGWQNRWAKEADQLRFIKLAKSGDWEQSDRGQLDRELAGRQSGQEKQAEQVDHDPGRDFRSKLTRQAGTVKAEGAHTTQLTV